MRPPGNWDDSALRLKADGAESVPLPMHPAGSEPGRPPVSHLRLQGQSTAGEATAHPDAARLRLRLPHLQLHPPLHHLSRLRGLPNQQREGGGKSKLVEFSILETSISEIYLVAFDSPLEKCW